MLRLRLLRTGVVSSNLTTTTAFKRPFHSPYARYQDHSEQPYRARKPSGLSPSLLVLGFIPIFTFGLGTWQIQRLKWKVNLIDELYAKLQRPPIPLPNRINLDALPDFTFRRVLLKGRWDHAHSILLGPRVYDGTKGFHLITPLVRSDGGTTLLVDRGFVSEEFVNLSKQQPNNEEVQVLGMLRRSQIRNRFTPDNKPESGEWFWADVDAIAQHAGGQSAGVQPVFVEEIFDGHSGDAQTRLSCGIPIGRAPGIDLRNQHAVYALTWYSLSAATTLMFVHLLRRRIRSTARMPR